MRSAPTIFVSVPVSSFAAKHFALRFQECLSSLLYSLRQSIPDAEIYCAAEETMRTGKYSSPREATIKDFGVLERSHLVLFIYPDSVPTSALIELGYAIARQKFIVCVTPALKTLPFMAQSFHELLPNYRLLEANILEEGAIPLILSALQNSIE